MFLKKLRHNYGLQIMVFSVLSVLLWLKALIMPPIVENADLTAPLSILTNDLLSGLPHITALIAFALMLFEGVYLNRILQRHKLIPNSSFIGAFSFVLFWSLPVANLGLTPQLLAWAFLIPALDKTLTIYDIKEPYPDILSAAFMISMASMFYLPSAGYLLILWISFINYGLYKWREWIIPITGFIWPYLILFSIYYFTNNSTPALIEYNAFLSDIAPSFPETSWQYLVSSSVIVLVLISSFFHIISTIGEKIISIRKKYSVIIIFLFLILFISIFSNTYSHTQIYSIGIPLSIIFSNYILENKKMLYIESLIILLFLTAVFERI